MINIDGGRISLREFRADDLDDSMAIVSDDRVTKWLSFDSKTLEQQAELLETAIARSHEVPRSEYYLAVTARSSDRLIGFIRLALGGVQAGKLGYAIAYGHWGHGYATEAARVLVNYGFATLALHRITAAIGPDNAASIAVIENLGFTREGLLRDHVFTNGTWRDSVLYSILDHTWKDTRSR